MFIEIKKVFLFFFVILNTLFFVSCKKENFKPDEIEFIEEAFQKIDLEKAETKGFVILPNSLHLSIFEDESISVCRYFLEIPNEKEIEKSIKNISDKITTLYIQTEWSLQPFVYEDGYCTISGENSEKFLNIVIFKIKKYKKNLFTIHMSITNKI